MKFFVYFLLSLLALFPLTKTSAQKSDWSGKVDKHFHLKDKKAKDANKLKQWKKEVEDWGLENDYHYALSLDARLNTNGWTGGLTYLTRKQNGKKTIWSIRFSEIKHEKETKLQNTGAFFTDLGKNTPFIFGKINNAYNLQLGYGRELTLLPALLNGNMTVSLRYVLGSTLALTKPYYLQLIQVNNPPSNQPYIQTEKYDKTNEDQFLNTGFILGRAAWSKGLNELSVIPGLFAEIALTIKADKPKSFLQIVSIGANAAYYAKPLTIMAERKAYPYQISCFVGLSLGKRWR